MGVKIGNDMKAYYCLDGIGGTPAWTELAVRDLRLATSKGEADASKRGSGWKAVVGTLLEAGIDFDVVYDPEDEGCMALQAAYLDNSPVGFAFTDGPIDEAGTWVFQADCAVLKWDRNEPLENGVVTVSATVKPTYSANAPDWDVVA
jgi:hypothetical protein